MEFGNNKNPSFIQKQQYNYVICREAEFELSTIMFPRKYQIESVALTVQGHKGAFYA